MCDVYWDAHGTDHLWIHVVIVLCWMSAAPDTLAAHGAHGGINGEEEEEVELEQHLLLLRVRNLGAQQVESTRRA